MLCYCGSTLAFNLCCQPFIKGSVKADSCEQLMRSRYSAYCHKDIDYVFNTYHPSKRVDNSVKQLRQFAESCHFISLKLIETRQTSKEGYVCFTVNYLQGNLLQQFSEHSRFVYEQGWLYLDGLLSDIAPQKIGRNDLCPCGSNKKFKLCVDHQLSGQAI